MKGLRPTCCFSSPTPSSQPSALPRLDQRSATDQRRQFRGIAVSLHLDKGEGIADLAQIVGRQFDGCRADVLVQAMQLRGARNGNDPGLLRQQPSQCDLRGRGILAICDPSKQVNQRLIGLSRLRREARNDVAEVRLVEGSVLVDGAGEETLA
jgi:hypothetical protein